MCENEEKEEELNTAERRPLMSLTPHELEPIPEATRRLMQKACPNGTIVSRLRDALGPIYRDEDFAARVKEITKGELCDVV